MPAPRDVDARAGIGLRAAHCRDLLERRPDIGWLEVHSENYFDCGGLPARFLSRLREHYPLSLHGVGLSLGSTDPLNLAHLRQLKTLVERYEPAFVSDHLCWSSVGGRYFNELLPLPYTQGALDHVVARVSQVQDVLGRQMLVENVSSYLEFEDSCIAEAQFLVELARRSGCALLLDVNNVYVSAHNHGFDALAYLAAIPPAHVREIHLAGHSVQQVGDHTLCIDTHDQRVCDEVWALYRAALGRFGAVPTLIEWDTSLPALDVLLQEAAIADTQLAPYRSPVHARAA